MYFYGIDSYVLSTKKKVVISPRLCLVRSWLVLARWVLLVRFSHQFYSVSRPAFRACLEQCGMLLQS